MISAHLFKFLATLTVFQINLVITLSQCQNGWTYFANTQGGHCYNIFQTNSMTFYQTREACNIMGGYLATVDDQIEFDFITKTLLNNSTLKNGSTPWIWVNNTLVNF